MSFLSDRGVAAMVFEGGGHRDPDSVTATEAAIWLAMAGSGVISESRFPEVTLGRKRLMAASKGLPSVLEMRYRHPIQPEDGFRMLPGFRSFEAVTAGQTLAHDRRGEIRSPESGRLLMPLYQAQGEDGFFIIREFHPFWLTISEVLRRLRVDRVLHWMPGVQKDREHPGGLIVDRRVARWHTMEILHLLGFRKRLEEGDLLVVLRQAEGPEAPESTRGS
jgi:succinylglutamate desuccinylase